MPKARHHEITVSVPIRLLERSLSVLAERRTTMDDFVRLQLKRLTRSTKFYGLEDKLTFGKYREELLETVIRADPSYIAWCLREIEGYALTVEALELLSQMGVDL